MHMVLLELRVENFSLPHENPVVVIYNSRLFCDEILKRQTLRIYVFYVWRPRLRDERALGCDAQRREFDSRGGAMF